jgi:hypothetical protein
VRKRRECQIAGVSVGIKRGKGWPDPVSKVGKAKSLFERSGSCPILSIPCKKLHSLETSQQSTSPAQKSGSLDQRDLPALFSTQLYTNADERLPPPPPFLRARMLRRSPRGLLAPRSFDSSLHPVRATPESGGSPCLHRQIRSVSENYLS